MIDALSAEDGFDPGGYFVYLLWVDKDDDAPVYVGSSRCVISRLSEHTGLKGNRGRSAVRDAGVTIGWISLYPCASQDEMLDLEAELIQAYAPEFNKNGLRRPAA